MTRHMAGINSIVIGWGWVAVVRREGELSCAAVRRRLLALSFRGMLSPPFLILGVPPTSAETD